MIGVAVGVNHRDDRPASMLELAFRSVSWLWALFFFAGAALAGFAFYTVAMAIKDGLLADYDHEMGTTRKLLERLPEDKLAWKPHDKSMALGRLADVIRASLHPDRCVSFVVDRNVNYTNVCESKCKFCAFAATLQPAATTTATAASS